MAAMPPPPPHAISRLPPTRREFIDDEICDAYRWPRAIQLLRTAETWPNDRRHRRIRPVDVEWRHDEVDVAMGASPGASPLQPRLRRPAYFIVCRARLIDGRHIIAAELTQAAARSTRKDAARARRARELYECATISGRFDAQ